MTNNKPIIRICRDNHAQDEYCWFTRTQDMEDDALDVADHDDITAQELATEAAKWFGPDVIFHVYHDDRDFTVVEL